MSPMKTIVPDVMYWELTRTVNGNFDVVYIERYTRTDLMKEQLEQAIGSTVWLGRLMLGISCSNPEKRPVLDRTQDGIRFAAKEMPVGMILELMEAETLSKDK